MPGGPTPDAASGIPRVNLWQGEVHWSTEPKILTTVLGSCVAVCLWDMTRGAGGMNHFVLPTGLAGGGDARYGDAAIDQLHAGLRRAGCRTENLLAKVFGGAAVLPFAEGQSVGALNVRLALERLHRDRICIAVQRTGGTRGQQIRFHTATGTVLFRYLAARQDDAATDAAEA